MIATVTSVNPVKARVRRAHSSETIYNDSLSVENKQLLAAVKVGDRLEVKRVTNNPYLVLIGREVVS